MSCFRVGRCHMGSVECMCQNTVYFVNHRANVDAKKGWRYFSHCCTEWLCRAAQQTKSLVSCVAALKREVMYALQKSHEESQYGLTDFGTYTATIACGSFFRSICGYHVSGIRRKKRREKKARPRSSDDRVSSSHSGGSALATAGTNTAASTGISGPNENFLALLSPCTCITRRANGAAGTRGPMDVRGDARSSMAAVVQCIGENANDESMMNRSTYATRAW